jgi:Mn2+/Fe2+ NRAMP family transporter
MADFAGIASSLELFGISRFITVPLGAAAVWLLVVKGRYRSVEKIFLLACVVYVAYIVAGVLARPNWKEAAIYSVHPVLMFDGDYISMVIAMVGTSIAPWMQFYQQAAVVEKGVSAKEIVAARVEVTLSCILTSVVAFFIVVACAGAIYNVKPRDIKDAADAALGLKVFGPYAYLLFAAGLFNASLFAACILPLSTAYCVCEGLGFESGVDRRFREAPVFYWLFTLLIVVGAAAVMFPKINLVNVILTSQVINGILLPFVLIFMTLLINRPKLMHEWTNSRTYNAISWVSVAFIIGLVLALIPITIKQMTGTE